MAVAAYASLLSLMHVFDQILQHPARSHLLRNTKQIETLQEHVRLLLEFLEIFSPKKSEDIKDLARQITDAANEAEVIIDLHVVDQLRAGYEDIGLESFFRDIEKVTVKIDSIKKELMLVKEECTIQEHKVFVVPTGSLRLPVSTKNTMVGFDEHLVRIMDELTGHRSSLQIIPIVGMGGISKTTFATNVFDNPYVVHHFDILRWFSISQEYRLQEILLGLLNEQKSKESGEDIAE